MKRFGITGWRVAFQTADSHHRTKRLVIEPRLLGLRWEVLAQALNLVIDHRLGDRNVQIGVPQVALVLGDFVFANQVIAKSIPREF